MNVRWRHSKRISPPKYNENKLEDTTYQSQTIPNSVGGEVSGGVEFQDQIVSFSDDAVKIDEYLVSDKPQTFSEVRSAADSRTHTIIDFLERPRIVYRTPWPTTIEPNVNLIDLKLPDILLDKMNLNKLEGFASFSASVEIKIQINAQPFQAGLLILAACPPSELIGNRNSICKYSIDKALCLPHVLFDISKTSEISLTIPYVSPIQQYDLIRREFPWSDFFVKVYSKFVSNQTDSLDVLVWARFKDIKLGVPTAGEISSGLQLQAGEQGGPISNVVGTITDVVESVGGKVSSYLPSLKKFVKPGVQIGRGVQGLISALGFSKPQQLDQPCPLVLRPGASLANTDGLDTGVPMAARQSNSIEFMPAFAGSSADELSLDYVLRIPNYVDRFSYSTSDNDVILWSSVVSPVYNSIPFTDFDPDQVQPTNLKYISSFYSYWRGSLKYTFRFVKTNYHSGRVEFCFSPFTDKSNPTSLNSRSHFCYRVVGDLREQTEFTFLVPYVSTVDYKKVDLDLDPLDSKPVDISKMTGCVYVRALTPLQLSQALLPNSISCVVEVAAGPDFELAAPINSWYQPVGGAILSNTGESGLRVESGDTFGSTGTRDIRSSYIDNSFMPQSITGDQRMIAPQTSCAMQCIGEPATSLRELLKRPQLLFNWSAISFKNFYQLPLVKIDSNSKTLYFKINDSVTVDCSVTNLMRICSMYAFLRGGFNVKLWHHTNYKLPLACVRLFNMNSINDSAACPVSMEHIPSKSLSEFSLPYYGRCSYIPISDNYNASLENILPSWKFSTIDKEDCLMYVSAKDDLDLGYFLGPPRIARSAVVMQQWPN
uniref:Structural polyprotein n=1 Tax=PNG bee virus 3 TaxID=2746875 RepID=A0A7D4XUC2_9VIRU|nr:structural polyprotein [PNG bee virus 3]